ncbi:DUF3299 domain-containing protein [Rhodoflexus sp.]
MTQIVKAFSITLTLVLLTSAKPLQKPSTGENMQPIKLTWETLAKIKWEQRFNKKYNQKFNYPLFDDAVKALEGKEVVIKGFLLPVDVGNECLVLSRYPYESCFFCGGAGGPESVMEVYMKTPMRINRKTVSFKGKLRLNGTDVDYLIYILDEAEVVPDMP